MALDKKPKLLVLTKVSDDCLKLLNEKFDVQFCGTMERPTQEEALANVPGAAAVFCIPLTKIDKQFLDAAGPSLKVISTCSVGYDHIDLEECKKRNIKVGYLGAMLADVMAEFTIGLMIAVGRRFPEALKSFHEWGEKWTPAWLNGVSVCGSTIGIVGFGFIGQAIAKQLAGFGVRKVLYTGPNKKPEGDALGAEFSSLDKLLAESDFVIASCALNDATRKMFNREAFKRMKPSSIFINISRGDVVDQDALYEALTTKQIWAAGLDVASPEPLPPEHPLANLDNCMILPHIGTACTKLRLDMMKLCCQNIIAGINGEKMPIPLV